MADDTLPIVFRSRRLTGFVMTAVGAGIVAAGIAKAADDSFSHADDHFGPIVLSSQTTGWLMIAIGLPFALYALVTVVRGCPTLRLDDAGLLLSRCLQSPVQIAVERPRRCPDQAHPRSHARTGDHGRRSLSGDRRGQGDRRRAHRRAARHRRCRPARRRAHEGPAGRRGVAHPAAFSRGHFSGGFAKVDHVASRSFVHDRPTISGTRCGLSSPAFAG